VTRDPPPRITAPGWGEVPPTAGLLPRWRDLFFPWRSDSLESAICKRYCFSYIEIVSTGTAALLISFVYLREKHPGRNVVIVPAYTCPLVAIAAHAAGLRTLACDTAPASLDLDLGHLVRLVSPETLAVVPTHYGGYLTDVQAVRRTCPGVAIVEDAAQAFGATWHGDSVGMAGDIGVFSFGAGKGLTIYEGGAIVTRERETMEGLRRTAFELTLPDTLGEFGRALMLTGYHAVYDAMGLRLVYGASKRRALARDDEVGATGDLFPLNVDVTRIGAFRKRTGRAALDRLDAHLVASRNRFDAIADRLACIPGLTVLRPPPHARPSATSLFVALAEHPERDLLIRALWSSRLGVCKMFSRALADYPDMKPLLVPSDTPNARELAAGTITISTSSLLSPAAENVIVETLREFARTAGWQS
jgi:perosamine synthetase